MPILKDRQGDGGMSDYAAFAIVGMAICWVGILMLGLYVHGQLLEGNCSLDPDQRHANSRMAAWIASGMVSILDGALIFVVARLMLRGEGAMWAWVAGGLALFATAIVCWALFAIPWVV